MSALSKRFFAVALAIVAALCLTGSSRAFVTKVDGSLAGEVSFRFYLSANDAQPAKLRIVEFVVQEQKSEKQWTTAWEVKGKQSLDGITYGAKYESLSEMAPAKPLHEERNIARWYRSGLGLSRLASRPSTLHLMKTVRYQRQGLDAANLFPDDPRL